MEPINIIQRTETPLFTPTYLNIEYFFDKIVSIIRPVFDFLTNGEMWSTLGVISVLISLFAITIIIFSLVMLYEFQVSDRHVIEQEINLALAKDKERDRNLNPRWKYILTMIESPNDSDWRVAIIEADALLEEAFKERGLMGNTMSELLEEAKSNGYASIQSAWDAHLVRNKIAHEGLEYSLSQTEGRRIIKLYQNVFEDLEVI